MQRIYKYGDIPNISFTPDNELKIFNILNAFLPHISHKRVVHFLKWSVFLPTICIFVLFFSLEFTYIMGPMLLFRVRERQILAPFVIRAS